MMLIWQWIKSLFTKKAEVTDMADEVAVEDVSAELEPVAEPVVQTVTVNAVDADLEVFAAKVKSVLALAGHDVEAVWSEVVALAKKL